jgi:hypothetical protein
MSGTIPVLIDSLYILVNTGEIIGAIFFIIELGISKDALALSSVKNRFST